MNINEFIKRCKYHNWDYRSSTYPEIVYLAKKTERELYIAIKQNPEWVEIYYAYKRGALDVGHMKFIEPRHKHG